MKKLMICLFLSGCASNPHDIVGKPIDKAISYYGDPEAAVDYEGARAFFFKADDSKHISNYKAENLLNPSMAFPQTDYQINGCVVIANALWTSTREEWTVHSAEQRGNCK